MLIDLRAFLIGIRRMLIITKCTNRWQPTGVKNLDPDTLIDQFRGGHALVTSVLTELLQIDATVRDVELVCAVCVPTELFQPTSTCLNPE